MTYNYTQKAAIAVLYDEPREFAGQVVSFTSIKNGLYLTVQQQQELLGLSPQTIRQHINNIYREFEAGQLGGALAPPPQELIIYEVPMTYKRAGATWGGGGGTQNIKLHHHDLIIRVVERMANSDRKQTILNWMRGIVSQYVSQGYVIDDHAVINSPTVLPNLFGKIDAFNFSPERHAMAAMNNRIDVVFHQCSGIYNADGTVNYYAHNYFRRCAHNTAHVSAVGLTALQLRAVRADPNSLDFGQYNYRGKAAPRTGELTNACNFLTNYELTTRAGVVDVMTSRVMSFLTTHPASHYKDVLKMFTMYSVSPYVQYRSWDYNDYPETALDTILNMPDKSMLRTSVKDAIAIYLTNFPNRHSLPPMAVNQLTGAMQVLVDASIEHTSSGDQ